MRNRSSVQSATFIKEVIWLLPEVTGGVSLSANMSCRSLAVCRASYILPDTPFTLPGDTSSMMSKLTRQLSSECSLCTQQDTKKSCLGHTNKLYLELTSLRDQNAIDILKTFIFTSFHRENPCRELQTHLCQVS